MNARIKVYSSTGNLLHTQIVCNNIKEAEMYAHGAYEMAVKQGLKPIGKDVIDLDSQKEREIEEGSLKKELTNEISNKISNKIKSIIKEWDRASVMAAIDANESRQRTVKVTFDDGNTITTRINGTKQEIRDHYIGHTFPFDDYDHERGVETEKTAKAVNVEFLK